VISSPVGNLYASLVPSPFHTRLAGNLPFAEHKSVEEKTRQSRSNPLRSSLATQCSDVYAGRCPYSAILGRGAGRLSEMVGSCHVISFERHADRSQGNHHAAATASCALLSKNLNVAATISLAGLGLDRTIGRIIADPAATRNIHEVFVCGNFGEATVRLVNRPSCDNPKSSYLARMSVIATLQCISQQFQLGT
jgi:hypothetical protein